MVVVLELEARRPRGPARAELTGFAGPALLARESDERLAELVREGDENAFAAIVARYRAPLERHCRRTLAPSRAEDALQQAFANAYVALSRGARPQALRPWLYGIARNSSIDGLRDRQGEGLEEACDLGTGAQTHEIVAGRESLRSVVRAVVGLPARQREVLVRQEFEGRSQEQIAVELGLTTGAVRQLAHRARTTVRAAAAALVPAPLWRLLPWQLSPAGGGEIAVSSALGAFAGKGLVVLLMAGAAGGAVELSSAAQPAAPAGRVAGAHVARAALPAGAGTSGATGGRSGLPVPAAIAMLGGRAAAGQRGAAGSGKAPAGGERAPAADSDPALPGEDPAGGSSADVPAAAGAGHRDDPAAAPATEAHAAELSGSHEPGSSADTSDQHATHEPADDAGEDAPDVDGPDPVDVLEDESAPPAQIGAAADSEDTDPPGANRGSSMPVAVSAPEPSASGSGG